MQRRRYVPSAQSSIRAERTPCKSGNPMGFGVVSPKRNVRDFSALLQPGTKSSVSTVTTTPVFSPMK